MQRQRFLFSALALLTVWRLVLLPVRDLCPDEALAVVAGGADGWSWIETGPLMALLAKVSTGLLGSTELAARFFAPMLALITSLCVWRLARGLFDAQVAAWSVVILNVTPAFNLAAVTFTSGTVFFALFAALPLALCEALHRARRWDWSWGLCAALVALCAMADARGLVALPCVALALGLPRNTRRHLRGPGFVIIAAAWVFVAAGWLLFGGRITAPCWNVAAPLVRLLLLASPVVLIALYLVTRSLRRGPLSPQHALLVGFALPLLVLDLGWGAWDRWPCVGLSAWLVFATLMLAHLAREVPRVSTERMITLRTAGIALAALQTLALLHTDFIRTLGYPWPFAQRVDGWHTFTRFHRADPSSSTTGWENTAEIVREIVSSSSMERAGWFIITSDWLLAAELGFYLPTDLPVIRPNSGHPIAHPHHREGETTPFTPWERYDFGEHYLGANAIYITDDARAKGLPADLRERFGSVDIITIAEIKHGGQRVRTLRIFSCHGYRPSDG